MHWLYHSFGGNWEGWIQHKQLINIYNLSGSYTSYPINGLKLISINTNFCYNLNWWLHEQPTRQDPNSLLAWLIYHLQDAEDRRQRVWIIGHTALGDSSCFHNYSNYYYQIVNRYAPHVIAGQFFGHTHRKLISVYEISSDSFEVVNSHTFIVNLNRSLTWKDELKWRKEYSAADFYGSHDDKRKPLSPSWWHEITEKME